MSYLKNAMKRSSIQSLREYLLYGVSEEESYSTKGYEMRIKKAYQKWADAIRNCDPQGEDSQLYQTINNVITEYEHVYMELGIQAGFRLAKDIERSGEDEALYAKYKEMYSSLFQDVTTAIDTLQKALKNAEEIYVSTE